MSDNIEDDGMIYLSNEDLQGKRLVDAEYLDALVTGLATYNALIKKIADAKDHFLNRAIAADARRYYSSDLRDAQKDVFDYLATKTVP